MGNLSFPCLKTCPRKSPDAPLQVGNSRFTCLEMHPGESGHASSSRERVAHFSSGSMGETAGDLFHPVKWISFVGPRTSIADRLHSVISLLLHNFLRGK